MKSILRSDNPECDFVEDFDHQNGNYQNHCIRCQRLFMGHKRRVVCKACTYPIKEGEPVLVFTDIFHYVQSLKEYSKMSDEEAGTLYHILDMWQKKRYFEPTTFKLMEVEN